VTDHLFKASGMGSMIEELTDRAAGRHKLPSEPGQLVAIQLDAVGMCCLDNDLLRCTGVKVNWFSWVNS